jgi:hypothetical protein
MCSTHVVLAPRIRAANCWPSAWHVQPGVVSPTRIQAGQVGAPQLRSQCSADVGNQAVGPADVVATHVFDTPRRTITRRTDGTTTMNCLVKPRAKARSSHGRIRARSSRTAGPSLWTEPSSSMARGLSGKPVTAPRPGLNALQHSASAIPAERRRNQVSLPRTNAATASACSRASESSPAATPARSLALRFWLTFHLPCTCVSSISIPTMARSICST